MGLQAKGINHLETPLGHLHVKGPPPVPRDVVGRIGV